MDTLHAIILAGKKTFTNVEVTSSTSAGAVNVGDFGTVDGVVVKEIFFDDSLRKSGK